MKEAKLPARRARGGRWGLLATALVAAAALCLAAWSSYARVSAASRTLARGQGEALLTRVRARIASTDGAPTSKDLEDLVDEEHGAGLLYVGVVRLDGEVIAEAGKQLAPIDLSGRDDGVELFELTGADRVIQMPPDLPGRPPGPPPGRPPFGGPPLGGSARPFLPPGFGPPDPLGEPPPLDGPPGPRGPPGARRRRPLLDGVPLPPGGPPLFPALVVDFEPIVADALQAGALRTFIASSGAAVALMAAAIVFWWQLGERERLRERLERERRLAALGEMSAVLAHEIRNPLTALKGHAQLLVEQLEGGSREQKKAERIVSAAKRLEDLSTTLLDFIRSAELVRGAVDPRPMLQGLAEEVAPSRVDLSLESSPSEWSLDALRFSQVITNLLKNAIDASPPEAKIDVDARVFGGQFVLTVRDRGPGIPPGEEETIFEPFHTTRAQGTGLGLAVSRRIVEMHGGTLTAKNHTEGGALFRVSIPG